MTRYDKNYNEGASFKLTIPLSKLYIHRRRLNVYHSSLSILVVRLGGPVTAIDTRAESAEPDCFGSVIATETPIECYVDSQED